MLKNNFLGIDIYSKSNVILILTHELKKMSHLTSPSEILDACKKASYISMYYVDDTTLISLCFLYIYIYPPM